MRNERFFSFVQDGCTDRSELCMREIKDRKTTEGTTEMAFLCRGGEKMTIFARQTPMTKIAYEK
jgi:hypothetical protein